MVTGAQGIDRGKIALTEKSKRQRNWPVKLLDGNEKFRTWKSSSKRRKKIYAHGRDPCSMRDKKKVVTTTTFPLTELPLHEKGETGVFLWKEGKRGSMLGTDTRDLDPTSTFPSSMREGGMLTELVKALELHEKQLKRP
jgi:hypothetical protein